MRASERRLYPTCIEPGCDRPCPVGRRKCGKHLKTKGFKVTRGRDVRKGSNARGVAAHKPDRSRTRKAKRQNTANLGMQPAPMRAVRMNPARADRKPKEEVWQ